MARNGKVARLPWQIRTELNRRLQDGEPGTNLVEWLNGLEPVQEVLQEEFGGRPILEQNLSEWRQGGYQDWLRHEAARDFIDTMSDQSVELDEAAGEELISDRFGSVLAAEMARLAMKLLDAENDPHKRWEQLKEIHREFSLMRRDDHRAVRTWIKRGRYEHQMDHEAETADKAFDKENLEKHRARFWARRRIEPLSRIFGGGEAGKDAAAYILELENDLRPGELRRQPGAGQRPKGKSPQMTQVRAGQATEWKTTLNHGDTEAQRSQGDSQSETASKENVARRGEGSQPEAPSGEASMQKAEPAKQQPAAGQEPEAHPAEEDQAGPAGHRPAIRNQGKSDQIKPNQTKPAKPGLASDPKYGPGRSGQPETGVKSKVEGSVFNFERARLEEFVPEGSRIRCEALGVGREEEV